MPAARTAPLWIRAVVFTRSLGIIGQVVEYLLHVRLVRRKGLPLTAGEMDHGVGLLAPELLFDGLVT